VLDVRLVMELINIPVPAPSCVQLSAVVVVGSDEILQQIPLSVTAAPPYDMTSPPPDAVVAAIPVIAVVAMVGSVGVVCGIHEENLKEPMRVCQLPMLPFAWLL
jgi:hypothetical protein